MADTLRFLLIENDENDAELVLTYLNKMPDIELPVDHARSLAEAEQFLATKQYHVVLLDLNLDDSRGLDTFTKLFALKAPAAIVVLTGATTLEDGMHLSSRGAEDYVDKTKISDISARTIYAIKRHQHKTEIIREKEALTKQLDSLLHDLQELKQRLT